MIEPTPVLLVDEIRATIADLREAWCWLEDLVEPGRDSAPIPVLTDLQRARQAEAIAVERAERDAWAADVPVGQRQYAAPSGRYALAGSRPGARLAVIDARAAVHGVVLDVARIVAAAEDARYVGNRAGLAGVRDALGWLDGGPPCWVGTVDGVIWRTPPGGVLDQLHDDGTAGQVLAALARANRIAREAARSPDGEHLAPVDHRCPACGRRSLQLDYRSEDLLRRARDDERYRRSWTVTCISEACVCVGEGCGCRQRVRYGGRRHAWAYGELSGPFGLWAAVKAADARRRGPGTRVASEAFGHGGWSERRAPARVGRAVRDGDGVLWWDRARACTQLAIRPEQLWDWVRRSEASPRFPPLDRPRRDGATSWYRAEQLLAVEEHVATATRGRKRSA
ncbi:hypothetical protein ABZY58_26065 [Micromonospora tulbaghiae]|uniref:hypothetical protein n=1 Tax=Micromonospora tulbaghiae TaxID=479978 RepID=UPI0033AABA5C